MKCFAMLIAISVIAASAGPVKSLAQSSATSSTAPVTGMKPDRTTRPYRKPKTADRGPRIG
jgi:hypothetical protein